MKQKKRFIVRKYVIATSAREAIKKERTQDWIAVDRETGKLVRYDYLLGKKVRTCQM